MLEDRGTQLQPWAGAIIHGRGLETVEKRQLEMSVRFCLRVGDDSSPFWVVPEEELEFCHRHVTLRCTLGEFCFYNSIASSY